MSSLEHIQSIPAILFIEWKSQIFEYAHRNLHMVYGYDQKERSSAKQVVFQVIYDYMLVFEGEVQFVSSQETDGSDFYCQQTAE